MPPLPLSESAAAIILVMHSLKQQEEIEMVPMTNGKGFTFLYDVLWKKTQNRDVEEVRNATYGALIEHGILELGLKRNSPDIKFKFQKKKWGQFLTKLQGECKKLPSLGFNVKHKNMSTESWNIRLVERIDEELVAEANQVLKDGKLDYGSFGKDEDDDSCFGFLFCIFYFHAFVKIAIQIEYIFPCIYGIIRQSEKIFLMRWIFWSSKGPVIIFL